jgi:hypothetical protein
MYSDSPSFYKTHYELRSQPPARGYITPSMKDFGKEEVKAILSYRTIYQRVFLEDCPGRPGR